MSLFDLKISKNTLFWIFLFLIPVFLSVLYLSTHDSVKRGVIKQVINANTFMLDNGDIVHFHCIKSVSPVDYRYDEIASFLKLKMLRKKVLINPVVFVGDDNIEKDMIEKGYGMLKRDGSGKSMKECRELEFAEMKAQEEKKGIWKK